MSDVMLCGVLRMPKAIWADPLMLLQIQSRALEAADELERRADEIERLRAALKECADELAEQVEGHYAKTKDHPAMKRRYDRDMASVVTARALIEKSDRCREIGDEIERLRGILRQIADSEPLIAGDAYNMRQIARMAIEK